MIRALFKFLARILFRLLAFNILLVILPIAFFFYLDTYESQLLEAQEDSMVQQGRLISAALTDQGPLDLNEARQMLVRLQGRSESRIRIVDTAGNLIADSSIMVPGETSSRQRVPDTAWRRESEQAVEEKEEETDLIYDLVSYPLELIRDYLGPPRPDLESADYYTYDKPLLGPEIQKALEGKYGATTRYSVGEKPSIMLYSAIPIRNSGDVIGVVLVSQSTYRILLSIYEVRLGIIKIFLFCLAAAIVISILLSGTIARPLNKLKRRAEAVLDHRGRLARHFPHTRRLDEIGDLTRSLNTLTRRLEEHIKFIESFSADLSHEFRNPLASIRAAAEVSMQTSKKEKRSHFLNMILRDVRRMEHLLAGAREITRIDALLDKDQYEVIDLNTLLRRLIEGFKLRKTGITIKQSIQQQRIRIFAQPERLIQVFENLLDNAFSFSPPAGQVELKLFKAGYEAVVTISDQGPGIPPEHLEKIFERFFSFRKQEKNDDLHTGLGLAVVKVIITSYNGSVKAFNNKTGGACFEVRLPLKRF